MPPRCIIKGKGWTGEPIEVQAADPPVEGTELIFQDTAWLFETVEKHAVFTGMSVIVDGKECASELFVSKQAVVHPELGCRIDVRERTALSEWQVKWKHCYYAENVLVNFHGQVVLLTFTPISEQLQFLVDLAGEPTGIR